MPALPAQPAADRCGPSIALPVLESGPARTGGAIRTSKMGKWRAGVLIAVHLAIAAHIIQWLASGMADGERATLSPVEPSESMYTLELGRVNAGFVMFTSAILATAIFGRFFCGWGCHIVALQDLCAWMMKKVGIRPKPWRSRLLLWAPFGLASYMFLWPTLRREVIAPLCERLLGEAPAWLGEVTPLHGFTHDFIVENFWATFASWPVAIPYLLAVGFASVYFLGSKGFCTYGCPYGGFFGPVDRLAPVRIRVTDACNHCGHCTAVCTSNVRVADEVRDYGSVISQGCFKCLDCVSVCPNGALYVGVGLPAILTRARTSEGERAVRTAKAKARYDLTLGEEVLCGAVFLVLFRGFRGMPLLGEAVPMLMAAGIAGVGTFFFHKTLRMLRDLHVRGPRVQLKLAGRITPAGWVFALAAVAMLALGAQGSALWFVGTAGENYAARLDRLTTGEGDLNRPLLTRESVYRPGYAPTPEAKRLAEQAIAWYRLAGPLWRGGVGFYRPWEAGVRLAWLHSVAGDLAGAEASLLRTVQEQGGSDDVVTGLALLMRLNAGGGKKLAEDAGTLDRVEGLYRDALAKNPALPGVRLDLANLLAFRGKRPEAGAVFEEAVAKSPGDVKLVRDAAALFMQLGQADKAAGVLRAGIGARPRSAALHADLANLLLSSGKTEEGRRVLDEALRLDPPSDALSLARLYECLVALKRNPEALKLAEQSARQRPRNTPLVRDAAALHMNLGGEAKALELLALGVEASPRDALLRAEKAAMLVQLAKKNEALAEIRRVIGAEPRDAITLDVIAYVLRETGKGDEAKPFADRAAAIRAALGPAAGGAPAPGN